MNAKRQAEYSAFTWSIELKRGPSEQLLDSFDIGV